MSESGNSIEKLRGAVNYRKWRDEVKALLQEKGLYGIVLGTDQGSGANGAFTQEDLAMGDAGLAPQIPIQEVFKANYSRIGYERK
ncbi:hypothetical protein FRC02_006921, partial [Tulasnella sp. 418]